MVVLLVGIVFEFDCGVIVCIVLGDVEWLW